VKKEYAPKKSFVPKAETRFREEIPQLHQTKGGAQLLCPFCVPSHPLMPGVPNPCGTVLHVTAAQMIYTKKTVASRKLICSKCKQGGGEMVQYMNVYAHLPDCKPDTFLLPQLPTFSRAAALVFRMKDGAIKKWFEDRYGSAQQVQDIDADGNKTGKVLGCFFLKIPQVEAPS
jgi:hypothetical protein